MTDNWRTIWVSGQTNPNCDNLLPAGWYRFLLNGVNANMITSAPAVYSCGTYGPVWWNGSYNHRSLIFKFSRFMFDARD